MADRADDVDRKAHSLLMEAVELEPEAWRSFLDARCAGDPRLRRSVESLLVALDASQTFLEQSPIESPPSAADAEPTRIGPFRILRPIGAGGMARVFEAMQERPNRRVAVKLLKHGIRDAAARRRFEFETEVLARLRHPNIAGILEAGSHDDGSGSAIPYFAMEYVPGARIITEYADQEKLDRKARLELLAGVCDAVQHGHDNGVIHRDLKPANILVDNLGQPKVIDFGIARSTDPDHAILTAEFDPGRLVGTLHYMSPEQCAGAADIDVRTDIYSLGMILYELLCGRRPHELSGVPIPEALRIVQRDAPPRPGAIDPRLRGDLEAMILKAVDKDPARRYRTAASLEADIRRYLADRPIEARAPNLFHQSRLFARRHRTLVVAGVLGLLFLVAASALTTALALHARAESTRRRDAESVALAERDLAVRASYVANIQAARAALQFGEHHAARRSLAQAPPELRGWEWRLLNEWSDRSAESVVAHRDQILAFAVALDNRRFATGSRDGTIRIWDVERHAPIAESDDLGARVLAVAFSPDGTLVASGDDGPSVRLWDAETGREIRRLAELQSSVRSVAIGPGEVVVAATADGACRVYRLSDPSAPPTRLTQEGGIHGVAFTRDLARLVTWSDDGRVAVRGADDLDIDYEVMLPGAVYAADSTPDGRLLAAGGAGGNILLWAAADGSAQRALRPNDSVSTVRAIALSPDGGRVAAGFADREIRFWNVDDGSQRLDRVRGHEEGVSGLAFTRDGAELVSTSWDRSARRWVLGGPGRVEFIASLAGHAGRVYASRFSPDGELLVSVGEDGTLRFWDPELATPLAKVIAHRRSIASLALSPDGRTIATGSHDRTISVRDALTGVETLRLAGHAGAVSALDFDPRGGVLASGSDDASVRLWDLRQPTSPTLLSGHTSRVQALAFSPDGTRLASGSRDHTVRVWDLRRLEQPPLVLAGHSLDVFAVLFSPDGELLYTGARDQTVRIWEVRSGVPLAVLDGHGQFITSLDLSPDGRRLAAGSWFGEVLLWDLPSRELILSFKAHETVVRSIAFDPTGRWLVSASYDGTIRLFDETPRSVRLERRAVARAAYASAAELVGRLRPLATSPRALAQAIESEPGVPAALVPWAKRLILAPSLVESTPIREGDSALDAQP